MNISADILRSHLAYSEWASRKMLDAAHRLSPEELTRNFGTADGSVLGTLAHIFAADRAWISRLRDNPPGDFITGQDRQLETLDREWPLVTEDWRSWAAGLTDEVAASVTVFRDLKGRQWRMPVWQPVLHVVNHGTHHRGQIAGFLRAMGHPPPRTDLVIYYRELG